MSKKKLKKSKPKGLVTRFGEMWARNSVNIKAIPNKEQKGQGVYILYDGSMPMYVGMGNIRSRIKSAQKSTRRKEMWDHFSWYALSKPELMHDIEALLLRALPPNLRSLTGQKGKFNGLRATHQIKEQAIPIKRKRVRKKKRTGKKQG
jgi:hypothetical protein